MTAGSRCLQCSKEGFPGEAIASALRLEAWCGLHSSRHARLDARGVEGAMEPAGTIAAVAEQPARFPQIVAYCCCPA